MENLDEFVDFVVDYSNGLGFDKKAIGKIRLAFEEAIVNVIKYAYPEEEGNVEVVCSGFPKSGDLIAVKIVLIDSGIEFNPLTRAEPDIALLAEQRPIGGLGIFMIKKIMDTVEYQRVEGNNILIMTKNI